MESPNATSLTSRSVRQATFANALLPVASRGGAIARGVLLLAGCNLLLALSGQLSFYLPFNPAVPVTAQTFAVLLIGALLGWRLAAGTVAAFLLEGIIGMPVFANGSFGALVLVGPSGGYLFGFLLGAVVVGVLCERGWDRNLVSSIAAMLIGDACIFAVGLLELARFVPIDKLLLFGLVPFLPGDAVKVVVAALPLPAGWRVLSWVNQR